MARIDLNCDLGESYSVYTLGMDREVIPYISSANVACGYHAGDPLVMRETVALCKENNVRVGAHPGLPDRMGFGRRYMEISAEEACAYIQYQLGALKAFCGSADIGLYHVKPHGALYNMAAVDYSLAKTICEAIAMVDENLVLLCLSGSEMVEAAIKTGLPYASEVFADRAYQADGTLVPRNQPGAMIEDEDKAIARVVRMATEGKVLAQNGEDISVQADSVCVHGDGPKALEFVRRIQAALKQANVTVCGF